VIVKRVYARPGKGKAAYYLGTAGPTGVGGSGEAGKSTGSGAGGGAHAWHRGNITKRFDGKEDPTKPESGAKLGAPSAPVRNLFFCLGLWLNTTLQTVIPNNITDGDEAAAMAAMFQQQTANWEETQEKMSQLVLPRYAPLCSVVQLVPNERNLLHPAYLSIAELSASSLPREVVRPQAVEASHLVHTTIGHYHPATFAIAAERKTTGFKTAQPTTIEIMTIGRVSSVRLVSLGAF
jgi:hypothetical protein